jgi:glycerophosphoryl diester phosphodiesterase
MAEEVVIMSLKYDRVAKTKALRPGWTYGFLTSVSLGDNSQFEVNFLAINKAGAKRRFVRATQQSGRELYVWTVNDPLVMSSMLARGVDGLITDEPALARRVLEIRADLNPIERLLVGLGTEVGVFSIPVDALGDDQ